MNDEFINTPDWVKNAVFYQIFPDRFSWSSRVTKPGNFEPWDAAPTATGFKGGDLMGVFEKLDYLEDLGINAIYFNPIFQSASNHRYHTHDYYQVDPLLGGNEAFKTLVNEAHRRNIRIVLDGVFNHASRGFFQFNHILEVGRSSPYVDWFHIHGFPLDAVTGKNYESWWSIPALPKFNTNNPQVRQFIFDIARYWIDQGIDGWRLDVPFEIDDDAFWQDFRRVVKRANPEAYIVGEIPSEARRWLCGQDQFDAVMNYQISHAALAFFGNKRIDKLLAGGMMGLPTPDPMDAQAFAARTMELLSIYPIECAQVQMNLLDSHDTPRFLSLVQGDTRRLALAWLFLLTYPGAPTIYYGDEIGLDGGRDPLCRKGFPWDESKWNQDLRARIQELITLRHAMPAMRTGSYEPIYTQGSVLAYLRRDDEETVLVIVNAGDEAATVTIPTAGVFAPDTVLQDQVSEKQFTTSIDSLEGVTVPGLDGLILA